MERSFLADDQHITIHKPATHCLFYGLLQKNTQEMESHNLSEACGFFNTFWCNVSCFSWFFLIRFLSWHNFRFCLARQNSRRQKKKLVYQLNKQLGEQDNIPVIHFFHDKTQKKNGIVHFLDIIHKQLLNWGCFLFKEYIHTSDEAGKTFLLMDTYCKKYMLTCSHSSGQVVKMKYVSRT